MPVVEFQRLPPESDDGEPSGQGDFFTVAVSTAMTENPNYSARTAKWLGILQLIIAFCCVIDGIVTESLGYCSISSWATPIWSGFPCFFFAGLLALLSRNKKTSTIIVFMVCSTIAMLAAVTMVGFMLVSGVTDYHQGYPFSYVRYNVAAKLGVCFGFDIFGIILGFIEVFAALTGIMIGSDRNRQPTSAHSMGCRVMGDVL
ncbi:uncharacterized protein LOC117300933 [Asterias rubens]|uniref:uncharacterized protein LOC117300933 n=1 Tax=Asterias rubens TaxID=7604 RepID=UPI0014557DA3|nr:uncharacterized protein LOC117300933 [Asterias rubens]